MFQSSNLLGKANSWRKQPTPKVVVNSTPIIVLANIGLLDVLRSLYVDIYIPQAVYDEVTLKKDSVCYRLVENREWVHVCKINDLIKTNQFPPKLHLGEVEVMILAQEIGTDLVIMDDNAAKKTAKALNLKITGTLGVLLKAKKLGFIHELQPVLDTMIRKGFYVERRLVQLILREAGELG